LPDESDKKAVQDAVIYGYRSQYQTLRPAELPANSDFVGQRAQFVTKPAEYVLTFTESYDSWACQHRFGRPFTERLVCQLKDLSEIQ
jgi:hypothetical protein